MLFAIRIRDSLLMGGLGLVLCLLAIAGYWWDTSRCKELARDAGKAACIRYQVQFLDDTVERKKIWFRRSNTGRLQFCRLYFFEFTSDGLHRYQGRILMTGQTVADLSMDAYRV